MARAIYEIKLKKNYYPALTEKEALQMWEGSDADNLNPEDVVVTMVVKEEHAVKLFLLAKTMTDSGRFEADEVCTAIRALVGRMGYFKGNDEIAHCIMDWVERCDELSMIDFEEWLLG